jgi:hypothetical protein
VAEQKIEYLNGFSWMYFGVLESFKLDYDRPLETFAHSHPTVAYPCYPEEIRLGVAAAKEIYCLANPNRPATGRSGFDALAAFFHPFYKPYNLALDFTDMNLYIARGKARP